MKFEKCELCLFKEKSLNNIFYLFFIFYFLKPINIKNLFFLKVQGNAIKVILFSARQKNFLRFIIHDINQILDNYDEISKEIEDDVFNLVDL